MPDTVQYQVVHETIYRYAWQVVNGQHLTHLTPRHTARQEVLWHALTFDPVPVEDIRSRDYYGNHCHSVLIQIPHDTLQVTATTQVRVQAFEPAAEQAQQPWEHALAASVHTPEALEVADMRLPSSLTPALPASVAFMRRFFTPGRPWLAAMLDLTQAIKAEFTYDPDATDVDTPLHEVIASKRGVCQDFAHLMLSCLRSSKLPARYMSGYIRNDPPPGKEKLAGADASHAWVESFLPGVGWVGFDPTNGKLADTDFITVAWGRDFSDVTPLRGVVLGGGEHKPEVRVTVTRLD